MTASLMTLLGALAFAETASGVSFTNEVVPILTRLGCNSGSCHGKATGQNGFRLSLLGFDPAFDLSSITRDLAGRRVDPGDPEGSLLLLKPTAALQHGGGKRLTPESDEYRTLRQWIEDGAPARARRDPDLIGIAVSPASVTLAPLGEETLAVTARFSDGSTRDVTRLAVYQVNEPELARVSEDGRVTAQKSGGLFAVMVRFSSEIAVCHGSVPFSPPESAAALREKLAQREIREARSAIDRQLFAQWKRLGVEPSDLASDAAFIRRATLDICGTLPTSEEVHAYVTDTSPEKLARLVDRLLERPEYSSYFGLKWANILENRGRGYSTSRQRPGTTLFSRWLRDAVAENVPYDRLVASILTATGSQRTNPAAIWHRSVRTLSDYVEAISQAFLGVRIQCAQCHHHPAEKWSQGDYYGLAAVFARVGRKGGFADAEVPTDEVIYLGETVPVTHPRTGEALRPRPLGGPEFTLGPYDDPRRALARWMTAPENPFFARTMANRIWGHFLGRGIIEPIDDARSSNPPTNPELLEALAADFVASGYDVKHLIRTICNSCAYRLSSTPNGTNGADGQSFARFYPRRLAAEVLLDGISQVTGVPSEFPGGPGVFPTGTRAIDLPDENVQSNFLDVFGRPARASACECERTSAPSLGQALELINSPEIQRKLSAKGGYVDELASNSRPHRDNVPEIFWRLFARAPGADELARAVDFLEGAGREEGYRSLVWSLLVTNEFLFNL